MLVSFLGLPAELSWAEHFLQVLEQKRRIEGLDARAVGGESNIDLSFEAGMMKLTPVPCHCPFDSRGISQRWVELS